MDTLSLPQKESAMVDLPLSDALSCVDMLMEALRDLLRAQQAWQQERSQEARHALEQAWAVGAVTLHLVEEEIEDHQAQGVRWDAANDMPPCPTVDIPAPELAALLREMHTMYVRGKAIYEAEYGPLEEDTS